MRRLARMPWTLAFAVLAVGCHKPYFMTEMDYSYYNRVSGDFQTRPQIDDVIQVSHDTPPTVRDLLNLPTWKLSLEDCKHLALANNKQITYMGYSPGASGTRIETALAVFDAQYSVGAQWARVNQQVSNISQSGGTNKNTFVQEAFGTPAGGYGTSLTQGGSTDGVAGGGIIGQGPGANLSSITKRNATGGITSFGLNVDYQRNNPAGFASVNPAFNTSATLSIYQPIFQGAGVEFNRAPTLIARANFEQSIKDFDASVRTLLRDVENQYWQLYFSYEDKYSREVGLEQALVAWQKALNRYDLGSGNKFDVAQAREQYELFRGGLVDAQNTLLTAETELRRLMGLPANDNRRLIPGDDPTEAKYIPDWRQSVLESMEYRPELASLRFQVRSAEIELLRQKNGLLPDLTLFGSYSLTGLDNQLDKSFNSLLSDRFTTWRLGGRYTRPLGERAANAATRQAQLTLSQIRARLRNQEHEVLHELNRSYREIFHSYAKISILRQRRRAAADQLESRKEFYEAGRDTIDTLVRAQATFADALRDEFQAVVQYNQALVQWEFAKGTIMINDNVALAEEFCSNVSDTVRARVQKQLERAKTLPIHKGDHVHLDRDAVQCPDNSLPLYREGAPVAPEAAAAAADQKNDDLKKDDPKKDEPKKPASSTQAAPAGSRTDLNRVGEKGSWRILGPAGESAASPEHDALPVLSRKTERIMKKAATADQSSVKPAQTSRDWTPIVEHETVPIEAVKGQPSVTAASMEENVSPRPAESAEPADGARGRPMR